ncbi:PepSY-associated TM helix domain-containing protein [Solimonas terrae]|uniref:PepSY-associated TM helix domain-containing protein n=1 Tax=Solimonas terrae TaxID=1396819 RepID=A0A6M2BWE8_9GAMM|nr:PepSY-associated TM helix domain-containing protein [Solimonas terrae]NGY06828.1 hypothetical protein [Solimonas terrae]
MNAADPELLARALRARRRLFWAQQARQWHWISAALCLVAMLLFAFTGITLNHAAQIGATPQISKREAQLPAALLATLKSRPAPPDDVLPAALRGWLASALDVHARRGEWSSDEIYVSLPRPGGDAWLAIELADGHVEYERTDRGWIAWLNDLHKGRNTGALWNAFIDLFAAACLLFCLSGLVLLQLQAQRRRMTWPMVGLGLLLPLLLVLFFLHQG